MESLKKEPPLFKKTTKSVRYRQDFNISKCKHFEYSSDKPGYVVAYQYIEAAMSETFKLNKINNLPNYFRLPANGTDKGSKYNSTLLINCLIFLRFKRITFQSTKRLLIH